jgi:hypothetical protein
LCRTSSFQVDDNDGRHRGGQCQEGLQLGRGEPDAAVRRSVPPGPAASNHRQLAAAQGDERVPEIGKLREEITETDRQLASCRAALDAGGDPARRTWPSYTPSWDSG